MTNLNDQNFADTIKEGVTLVDFWAEWCGPCHILAPTIEELGGKYAGQANVSKLNVDENPTTAGNFGVMSIPTVILFKNGQEVQRFVGVQPKGKYVEALDEAIQ